LPEKVIPLVSAEIDACGQGELAQSGCLWMKQEGNIEEASAHKVLSRNGYMF
jgi:hypothetical protein